MEARGPGTSKAVAEGEPQGATRFYVSLVNSARLALSRLEDHLRSRDLAVSGIEALIVEGRRFVFCSKTGTPLAVRNIVRRGLDPALKAAGLPHLRWHDLRHVAAPGMRSRALSMTNGRGSGWSRRSGRC